MSEWKETEIYPRVPINWIELFLGEMGWFKNGLNFNKTAFGKGIPIINVTHLHRGKYASIQNLDELKSEAVKNVEEYSLKIGDILFARSSVKLEGTGQVAMVGKLPSEKTCFSGFIIRYRIEREIADPEFLNYLLRSYQYREFFISIATGTSIFNLTQEILSAIPVYLPSFPEQKAIAGVLCILDDKIDLLHRQNKTLEAMAETLFRQWFVEEVKEGWEEKPLSSISEHKKVNVQPNKNHSTIYRHYSIPAFDEKQKPVSELGSEIQSNKYKVFPNAILISKLNPRFPRVWAIPPVIEDNSICSTEFQVVLPNSNEWYGFIYCLLKSKQVSDELIGAAGGTSGSHQRVKPEDIFNITFPIPDKETLSKFDVITRDFWPKININRKQIRTLEKLRDTLLPKVMSGEIRVNMEG